MIEYEFWMNIGFATATQTETVTVDDMGYTDEEWETIPEWEQEDALEECHSNFVSNYLDTGWRKK